MLDNKYFYPCNIFRVYASSVEIKFGNENEEYENEEYIIGNQN